MKFQAVKGTRDYYPEQMRLRNYILDTWRRVSIRNGFQEYDAPIFEYLDLFTVKSGEEIAEQLFHFTDRGGRNLAIRPEITPSLARMVAAKINALPRPIKWFSLPRLCRAENPQRGRLREFFQWNIDVIGVEDIQADAECIFTLIDFLGEVRLDPDDVMVHIGSRPLVIRMLQQQGVDAGNLDRALLALDKRPKVDPDTFEKLCREVGLDQSAVARIGEFMDVPSEDCLEYLTRFEELTPQREELERLHGILEAMGAGPFVRFDWHIVRGLAYYTGVVYEALASGERAVAGGGRYDGLLELVGGPACPATGMGMGDVVLGILLDEKGKLPADLTTASLDFFVIDADEGVFPQVLDLVARLRKGGFAADCHTKRQNVGKQLKQADKRGASCAVLLRENGLQIKEMRTGNTLDMPHSEFLKDPKRFLPKKDLRR